MPDPGHDQHVESHFASIQNAGLNFSQLIALAQKILAFLATLSQSNTPTPPNTGE